ncbi:hypothetical protein L2735_16370 [Shewanella olleyana]|uniref:hypothetical protein n=1 Tax=Shewanella olleyana TaxID=135626 RepID=UPI00200E1C1C|nr:hypothetical protein [Shewanella olleyana]MCL1068349.1 hypothetical protein [Shewanella olleyana]
MQINTQSINIPNTQTQINTNSSDRPKGPPPPPPGTTPLGLEDAVSTLTDEQQTEVSEMLASLTKEQKAELKSSLDELKPLTENMSNEDIGSVFFEALTIASMNSTEQESSGIDTYA